MSISFEPTKVKFGPQQRSKSGMLTEQRERGKNNRRVIPVALLSYFYSDTQHLELSKDLAGLEPRGAGSRVRK